MAGWSRTWAPARSSVPETWVPATPSSATKKSAAATDHVPGPSGALGFDQDAVGDALGELGDVGDDADLLTVGLQLFQDGQGAIERVAIQAAKPLIDKQRLDPHVARGQGRQTERQRQRDQKRLPA